MPQEPEPNPQPVPAPAPRPEPASRPRSRQTRRLIILGAALVAVAGLITGISLAAGSNSPPGAIVAPTSLLPSVSGEPSVSGLPFPSGLPSASGLVPTFVPVSSVPASTAPPLVLPTEALVNGASEYPCSDEGSIHSLGGGAVVPFLFFNNSSESVQIIWLNYAGARQTVETLRPGGTYKIDTYIGNVWMIASSSSSCLFIEYISGTGDVSVS